MRAVFKADGAETDDRYCISEWWLNSGDSGPGPHSHEDNVEIFYVIEGTMSFLVDEEWRDAPRGTFLRIPAGVTHTFENRSQSRAGMLHVPCREASKRRCRRGSSGSRTASCRGPARSRRRLSDDGPPTPARYRAPRPTASWCSFGLVVR
jgi:uncharacterized cupin superfamily protein